VHLLDWLTSRKSKPGEASGDRVNEAILQDQRLKRGLPPQKAALLIDLDGTTHHHDLDVHEDGPSQEVKTTLHKLEGVKEYKTYRYVGEDDCLIYHQTD
jgi:hypothetical protein